VAAIAGKGLMFPKSLTPSEVKAVCGSVLTQRVPAAKPAQKKRKAK
jgi:hypothetical protein